MHFVLLPPSWPRLSFPPSISNGGLNLFTSTPYVVRHSSHILEQGLVFSSYLPSAACYLLPSGLVAVSLIAPHLILLDETSSQQRLHLPCVVCSLFTSHGYPRLPPFFIVKISPTFNPMEILSPLQFSFPFGVTCSASPIQSSKSSFSSVALL
eukprot:Gb_13953 [translate_table: standard]